VNTASKSDELKKAMVDEAIWNLTEKPINTATMERIRLFGQADRHVGDMTSQPRKFAAGVRYVLDRITQPVQPYDLLMGRITEEISGETNEAYMRELSGRYAHGRNFVWPMPPWMYDRGHTSFYWKDLVGRGLCGLRERAIKEKMRRESENADIETLDYLQGIIEIYEAIQAYLRRYADAAEAAGLHEAAEACRNGADRAPETFREALQLIWTVEFIFCSMLCGNGTLTLGRVDQLLYPLYERDLKEGRLTREQAGLLILDYYCKNNVIMGRGEHQMGNSIATGFHRNLAYDSPQYMILAGSDGQGNLLANDLTLLFAEQIVPRFKNPVVTVRYAPGLARQFPKLWGVLADRMRNSASLMVYNEKDTISAYIKAGADPEDAATCEYFGCNWPIMPGVEDVFNGMHYRWFKKIDLDESRAYSEPDVWDSTPGMLPGQFLRIFNEFCGDRIQPEDIEPFYRRLALDYENNVRGKYKTALANRETAYNEAPGALLYQDCFFRDTVKSAKNSVTGGSKYYSMLLSNGGIASLADCVTAVDKLVYRDKKLTLDQLKTALDHNFEGYGAIRALCQGVPKFGSDDELSNHHARKLLMTLTGVVYKVKEEFDKQGHKPIIVQQCLESDNAHIWMAFNLGATPDGRLAGTPISQNSQPAAGASVNGLSARFSALSNLPFDRIMSGAQNVTIQPGVFAGEDGLKLLSSALAAYFEMGGLQTQISAVDADELRDAQIHPESHRDLLVRVTGYSAVFVDMSKDGQNDIINREEMGA